MESFAAAGVTGIIELAPAGALVGLAKRGLARHADRRHQDPRRPARQRSTCCSARARKQTHPHDRTPRTLPAPRPRVHPHPGVRRRPRRERRAERRPRRPDRLVRRVDPAAHRHHHPQARRQGRRGRRPRRDRRARGHREGRHRAVADRRRPRRDVTHTVATPSMASLLAERIGATPAAAYDISAACAGYTYGIAQADSFIKSGLADYVLVVGAEKLSDVVDPTDRSISFLLGDGAGAAVVGPSDFPGISPTIWGSDGSKWDAIGMTATYNECREARRTAGRPCARRARRSSAGPSGRWSRSPSEALETAGIRPEDLAAFVPHQANMRIIDEFAKQLGLPETVDDRPRHHHHRQHLGREHPARHAPPARGAPRAVRRPRPADRLRRRTRLRRAGRRPPLNPPGRAPAPTTPTSLRAPARCVP